MKWFWGFVFMQVLISCRTQPGLGFLQTSDVVLANPIVEIDSILFIHQAKVQITKSYSGSEIRYTVDGTAVTSESPICPIPFFISENRDIKIKAFHPNFKPSESIEYSIRKINPTINFQLLASSTEAKSPYIGHGLSSATDGIKAEGNFQSNQDWLGYQNEVTLLVLQFESAVFCNQIILSTLRDQPSWIFSPKKIEILNEEKIIVSKSYEVAQEGDKSGNQFFELPISDSINKLTIKIYQDKIPTWHPGKGSIPWLFLDEIIVQ